MKLKTIFLLITGSICLLLALTRLLRQKKEKDVSSTEDENLPKNEEA